MKNFQAFPRPMGGFGHKYSTGQEGMSFIDYTAIEAMKGILSNHNCHSLGDPISSDFLTSTSYSIAISMLETREKILKELEAENDKHLAQEE